MRGGGFRESHHSHQNDSSERPRREQVMTAMAQSSGTETPKSTFQPEGAAGNPLLCDQHAGHQGGEGEGITADPIFMFDFKCSVTVKCRGSIFALIASRLATGSNGTI